MRISFNIALVISILFFPWWVFAPLMIAGCFLVPRFYEVFIYGVAFDALYASPFGLHGFSFVWSLSSALSLALASFLRSRLSW
jgi:cell shape-determining protein MreD